MNFVFELFLKGRNSCVKSNFFKVQGQKTNFIQNLAQSGFHTWGARVMYSYGVSKPNFIYNIFITIFKGFLKNCKNIFKNLKLNQVLVELQDSWHMIDTMHALIRFSKSIFFIMIFHAPKNVSSTLVEQRRHYYHTNHYNKILIPSLKYSCELT